MQNDPVDALKRQLERLRWELSSLALAMPEANYQFAPAGGTRTFAEQLKHLATLIFLTASLVRQERSPHAPGENDDGPAEVRSKAEIVAYLDAAFDYAKSAMELLAGTGWTEEVPTYFGPQSRLEVASGIVYHSYNHYGQMVVYARLCGIIPGLGEGHAPDEPTQADRQHQKR